MKHVFIINSKSSHAKRTELEKQIASAFSKEEYAIIYTNYAGHAKKIAKEAASKNEEMRIYACGGDGTLHEVVNGILSYPHIELAVVPIGTGNDFIKSFPSLDKQDFLDLKNYHHIQRIYSDIIMINDQASVNTVSAGLDVKVAYHVAKFKQFSFFQGIVPYFLGLLVSLIGKMTEKVEVQIDNDKYPMSPYLFIVAGNGRYYGGGYCPAPNAQIDDGWFDYSLIKKVSRFKILSLSGKYKKGTHLSYTKFVASGKAKKMQILTNGRPIRLNLDGELYETADPQITLYEKRIQIVLPKK